MTILILPFPPSSNVYWRYNRGHIHRSNEANAYKDDVGWRCKAFGLEPLAGNIKLTMDFYRPAKRGDLDNRVKILIDALRGHAYIDDKQIVEIHAVRHDNKTNPHVAVEITEVV